MGGSENDIIGTGIGKGIEIEANGEGDKSAGNNVGIDDQFGGLIGSSFDGLDVETDDGFTNDDDGGRVMTRAPMDRHRPRSTRCRWSKTYTRMGQLSTHNILSPLIANDEVM